MPISFLHVPLSLIYIIQQSLFLNHASLYLAWFFPTSQKCPHLHSHTNLSLFSFYGHFIQNPVPNTPLHSNTVLSCKATCSSSLQWTSRRGSQYVQWVWDLDLGKDWNVPSLTFLHQANLSCRIMKATIKFKHVHQFHSSLLFLI